MASIADVFFQALLDDSRLQVDAKKAGDKAGQTAGQSMSAGIASGLKKLAFGGLAAGFGLATKGLLELENITADFTAETGASADEAKRAGQAINEMAGRNIQPMAEIGKALTKVHTDLGLTGAEAEKTTEAFLTFGRATKQDASAAVVAFDDILDAWGLTAADSQRIMDNLVASHQKYGGSIEENERSLSNLAPQLKALNLDVDDGVALLNLFAASGLDASKAQFALNSAIQKLPPGTSLDEFVGQLAAIEDPAERARKAIEVFGARGGAGLANAIRPGMKSLDDFKVSEEELTGATAEAAAAMDNTWGARAQLLIKGATSKLIEFGAAFGPVLTGFASLASLGGALGLDKLLVGSFGKLKGSAAVKGAAKAAGLVIGAVFSLAMFAVDKLVGIASAALSALGVNTAVLGSAAGAGKSIGLRLAAGLAAGMGAAAIIDWDGWEKKIREGPLAQKLYGAGIDGGEQLADGIEAGAGARVRGGSWGPKLLDPIFTALIQAAGTRATELGPAINDGLERGIVGAAIGAKAHRLANLAAGEVAKGINEKRSTVDQAWTDLLNGIDNAMSVTAETAGLIGRLASKELRDNLHAGDPALRAQAQATKQIILDRLMELKPRAGTLTKDAMKNIKKLMKDSDPDIRAAATTIYNAAISGPKKLPAKGTQYGKALGENLADGIESKQHRVETAAARLAGAAGSYLKLSSPAKKGPWSQLGGPEGWGQRFGNFLVRGLENSLAGVNRAVSGALATPMFPTLRPAALGASVSLPMAGPSPYLGAGAPISPSAGNTYIYETKIDGLLEAKNPLQVAVALSRIGERDSLNALRRTPR